MMREHRTRDCYRKSRVQRHRSHRREHVHQRAFERFGIDLTKSKRIGLVERLQRRDPETVILQSTQDYKHISFVILFEGTLCKVIYDRIMCEIVTFLYPTEREIIMAVGRIKKGWAQ